MPTFYISFDTEEKALAFSAEGFNNIAASQGPTTTKYLYEVRESTDGKWYVIVEDTPRLAKYKQKWWDTKVSKTRKALLPQTPIEPEWLQDMEI